MPSFLWTFSNFKEGNVLLKEGQYSKESYFVLKGCIRTFYLIDGEEKTTDFYIETETLSPPCVINMTPSEYYVDCIEDCTLLISNSDMEEEVNRKFPKFEIMCRRLSEELLAKERLEFDEFRTSLLSSDT